MEKKEEEMKSKWGMGNIPLAVGIWFRHPKYKINSPDFFFLLSGMQESVLLLSG